MVARLAAQATFLRKMFSFIVLLMHAAFDNRIFEKEIEITSRARLENGEFCTCIIL
jgi:hypothetical protein